MVSPLSGLNLRQAPAGTMESLLAGRQAYEQSQLNQQAIKQNEQQIGAADQERAMQKLSVINRLAVKARSLPSGDRQQFVQSINHNMLQSVGINPADLPNQSLDDQSLDALIAQTSAALPQTSQYRKESINTTDGIKVFDPATGTYVNAVGANGKQLTAPQYDPTLQGQIAGSRQNAQNQSDLRFKPDIQAATTQAELNTRLGTEPQLRAAISAAEEQAKATVDKQIAQAGQLGRLSDAEGLYNSLRDSDLDIIYGKGESWYPEFIRSQRGIDLLADKEQLIGMLQLAARGDLKGTGAIGEGEQKILSNSATVLSNKNISPQRARQALDEAMTVLRRNAGKSQGGSGKDGSTPGINSNIGRFKIEVSE